LQSFVDCLHLSWQLHLSWWPAKCKQ
jgi:hypothetical protein